jgi:quinol monooxygenase YgiN
MTITIATRADVRAAQLHRFVSMSVQIVNSMTTMPGNLAVRTTNSGLSWFTLTAWRDQTALDEFIHSERHRRAMEAVDQLTHRTAFARIDTDVPFELIPWRRVRNELVRNRTSGRRAT